MLRYARLEDCGHLLDHLDDGGGLVGGEDGGEEGAVVLVISVLRLLLQSEMSIVTRSPPIREEYRVLVTRSPPIREEYRDHVTLSPPIPADLLDDDPGLGWALLPGPAQHQPHLAGHLAPLHHRQRPPAEEGVMVSLCPT